MGCVLPILKCKLLPQDGISQLLNSLASCHPSQGTPGPKPPLRSAAWPWRPLPTPPPKGEAKCLGEAITPHIPQRLWSPSLSTGPYRVNEHCSSHRDVLTRPKTKVELGNEGCCTLGPRWTLSGRKQLPFCLGIGGGLQLQKFEGTAESTNSCPHATSIPCPLSHVSFGRGCLTTVLKIQAFKKACSCNRGHLVSTADWLLLWRLKPRSRTSLRL